MTTPIRIAPLTTVARFGVDAEERHVRPDQLEDDHGDDRAEHAAAAAGEAHAAQHDRRDALQRVGAGTGVPMPVLAVMPSPASAANRPITA